MYAVIDVETTGLTRQDRIIEIGIIQLDKNFEETNRWATLISTDRTIHPESVEVTGITQKCLSGKPVFWEVAERVLRLISGRVIVGHAVWFDLFFLKKEFRISGIPFGGVEYYDTSIVWPGTLDQACVEAGILRTVTHRALADADDTATLLRMVAYRNQEW